MMHPLNQLLLEIVYLLTWGTLLILEIKKILIIKREKSRFRDWSPIIIISFIIIINVIDIFKKS